MNLAVKSIYNYFIRIIRRTELTLGYFSSLIFSGNTVEFKSSYCLCWNVMLFKILS